MQMGRVLGITLVAALAACSSPNTFKPPPPGDHGSHSGGELADDDAYKPTYGKPELERALILERGLEASAEHLVHELEAAGDADRLPIARADLAVRGRFIATLEACQANARTCPPRLDDPPFAFEQDGDKPPPLDAALRFDLEDWQKITAELHGRACACRTMTCVDGLEVAIAQLEPRPTPEVQADDTAIQSVTRARECLVRLRGRAPAPPHSFEE
jgi:hypothetical protein